MDDVFVFMRPVWRVVALWLLLATPVRSSNYDEIIAVPRTFNTVLDVDRGAPVQVDIWRDERVGYSGMTLAGYAAYCHSTDDPKTGACPTSSEVGDPTLIRLRLVEQRTGLSVEVIAEGRRRQAMRDNGGRTIESGISHMHRLIVNEVDTFFSLVITPGELAKIPTGGLWSGVLEMNVVRDALDENRLAVDPPVLWAVNLSLRVTDKNRIDVYMPEFGTGVPRVDLNLRGYPRADGPGSLISGTHTIDACLYDGYNALSPTYEITMSDTASTNEGFFVRHQDATSPGAPDPTEHIPYRVWATNPVTGAKQEFFSSQKQVFTGTNTSGWRIVRMPFSPLPVACTPWLISLETPEFSSSDKRSGAYSGTLRVTFEPSTSAP